MRSITAGKPSTDRRSGKMPHQSAATARVPTPPSTMATAGPSSWPTTPDSNAPNSFDAPMNTASTASTRPRLSCGVTSGTRVERMNTLTASAPDSTSRATNATTKLVVTPSAMVPTPKSATASSSVRPMRRLTGRSVR